MKINGKLFFGTLVWIPFLVASCASQVAEVEETQLTICIKQYKKLGISADSALKECNKKTLAECIKRLMGGKFTANAIKEGPKGYLIDLGNKDSRWLEGKQWRELGCVAEDTGPYKRQSDLQRRMIFSAGRSYEWFRQGWCSTKIVTLEQPLALDEAKLKCEVGMSDPYSLNNKKKTINLNELPEKI